ncbi:hypothetical protein MJ904_01340 [Massilia sp. MB5]|uniref:hypothetical protein n=1 Tax=Massilia sp. MB5 TaxID=2919578 RepID=UPI001F0D62BC|nr:hypothetical protein [Massilia sp. MB5]UMR30942.1 hypothetical protein MJ904_01340 [Massilia sp. MB5]
MRKTASMMFLPFWLGLGALLGACAALAPAPALAPFLALEQESGCAPRLRLYLIDERYVYLESDSRVCSDANTHSLFDRRPEHFLCGSGGLAAATHCRDENFRTLFEQVRRHVARPGQEGPGQARSGQARPEPGLAGHHRLRLLYDGEAAGGPPGL